MADRGTVIVIKAIASGRTASVIIRASGNVETGAMGVASIGRAVYGVDGASVGVVANGWAIVIAKFIGLDNAVAARGAAIVVIAVVASDWATSIAVRAEGN